MPIPPHDAVVEHIARTRFPFPGQTTWPADYVTLRNVPEKVRGIPAEGGEYFPDLVIVDAAGKTREIGDVEVELDEAKIPLWRAASAAGDYMPEYATRIFFLYVPEGLEEAAEKMLDAAEIPFAGVRGYRMDAVGAISVVPYVTRGAPYDHQ